jgi:hypothetical protein
LRLADTFHDFHFSKPEALKNISYRYSEACAAIDQGRRARIIDRTGQIRTEPSIAKRSGAEVCCAAAMFLEIEGKADASVPS